jgi:hypothetical protein
VRKWLGGNGLWGVFSKCEGEIVEKMSNFAVTMGVERGARNVMRDRKRQNMGREA